MRKLALLAVCLCLGFAPGWAQDRSATPLATSTNLVEQILAEARLTGTPSQEFYRLSRASVRLEAHANLPVLRPVLERAETLVFTGTDAEVIFDRAESIAMEYWFANDRIAAERVMTHLMTFVDAMPPDERDALNGPDGFAFLALAVWNSEFGHSDRAAEFYLEFIENFRDTSGVDRYFADRVNAAAYLAGLGMIAPAQGVSEEIDAAVTAASEGRDRDRWIDIARDARLRFAAATDPASGIPAAMATSPQQDLLVDLAYDAHFRDDLGTLDLLAAEIEARLLTRPADLDGALDLGSTITLFETTRHCRGLDAALRYQRHVRELERREDAALAEEEKDAGSRNKQPRIDEDVIILAHERRTPVEIDIIRASAHCNQPDTTAMAVQSLLSSAHMYGANWVIEIYGLVGPTRIDAGLAQQMLDALTRLDSSATDDTEDAGLSVEHRLARAMLFRTLGQHARSDAFLQSVWTDVQAMRPGYRSVELALLAFALTV